MGNFDMSMSGMVGVSTSLPRLKPWSINDVNFEKAEISEFKGKADPSMTYKVLRVRFSNNEGYYEESIFFPKEGDDQRRTYSGANGEYEVPSSFERTKIFIIQTATILNPEGFEKMQAASSKFKSFDDMAKAYCTIMNQVAGKPTKLKLAGKANKDGVIEPVLPNFVSLSKDGRVYANSNFVGDTVFFTSKEEQKRAEYLNAKPSKLPDLPFLTGSETTTEPVADAASSNSEEFDLDSLL